MMWLRNCRSRRNPVDPTADLEKIQAKVPLVYENQWLISR